MRFAQVSSSKWRLLSIRIHQSLVMTVRRVYLMSVVLNFVLLVVVGHPWSAILFRLAV